VDSATLATRGSDAPLDPLGGTAARIGDDDTSAPTVGPDSEVFSGVLESRFGSRNGRGWLLQFNATLPQTLALGASGWDDTASIVPAAAVSIDKGSPGCLWMRKARPSMALRRVPHGLRSDLGDRQPLPRCLARHP
jgi:hypothetical protein